ncbi:MAG: hypothetical protein LRY71_15100 [Bacillaceae bacterium]|nr:hypothetical protein [Bacillaceae bacterium]
MRDSKIYGSMIISILSSSKNKYSALQAVHENFNFLGTLGMEFDGFYNNAATNEVKSAQKVIQLVEEFVNNTYPYLAGISLKETRRKHYHSS